MKPILKIQEVKKPGFNASTENGTVLSSFLKKFLFITYRFFSGQCPL